MKLNYQSPKLSIIQIDNEVSLILCSYPHPHHGGGHDTEYFTDFEEVTEPFN